MVDRDRQQDRPAAYSIQVQGCIAESWMDWLGGAEIVSEESDGSRTTLHARVVDQAALRGLLARIWDLNLTLVSLRRTEAGQGEGAKRDGGRCV
jgi:hypothetical protein